MEGTIRVTTEKLKGKGEVLSDMADQATARLRAAGEEAGRVEGCFRADAILRLEKAFGKFVEEGREGLLELMWHLGKLQEIALVYEEAEKENELATADN